MCLSNLFIKKCGKIIDYDFKGYKIITKDDDKNSLYLFNIWGKSVRIRLDDINACMISNFKNGINFYLVLKNDIKLNGICVNELPIFEQITKKSKIDCLINPNDKKAIEFMMKYGIGLSKDEYEKIKYTISGSVCLGDYDGLNIYSDYFENNKSFYIKTNSNKYIEIKFQDIVEYLIFKVNRIDNEASVLIALNNGNRLLIVISFELYTKLKNTLDLLKIKGSVHKTEDDLKDFLEKYNFDINDERYNK